MKRIVILATVHELQTAGHFLNSELEGRLRYLHDKFAFEIVMEEWSSNQRPSFAANFAPQVGLPWRNVGTPREEHFSTYTNPIAHPGHDGTLDHDPEAPGLSEYGPFQRQENRENRLVQNIQTEMANCSVGLFIVGVAHLHSLFGKLRSAGFDVIGYHWFEILRPN